MKIRAVDRSRILTAGVALALLPMTNRGAFAESLSALTPQAVESRLGAPDRKEASGSREFWHYGHSIVFFDNGQVTGWTDGGELQDRQVVAKVTTPPPKTAEGEAADGWVNSYTREKPIRTEDVIDELLTKDREESAVVPQ